MTIPKTFEESYAHVRELVDRFRKNESAYLSPKYQEAEVRQEFLDKFWVALGWDVYHQEQPNPYEREVRIEKSVMVGDRGKRADYAFYTRPNFLQARFMAEAKKPSRNLENQYDCFQAVRYGWNSNTPISVLTDFEQFLVLDSRSKPSVERSLNNILEKFHYTQFDDEEEFRRLYYLFAREAVGDGSLEKYVTGLKKAKKTKAAAKPVAVQVEPVGDTFLAELDIQRELLAKSFKRNNEHLDGDELTEITQRTLDRLVFIRFLEDKLVEPSEIIDRLGRKSGSSWRDFVGEMPRLNSIYNGIIFKPHAILDSPDFAPDDKTFNDLLAWLSHRNSAYDFNSIPIHILGSIYERFLGKTIVTTDKRARVEEKPEVRKAGGVYYTPEYIVRYIVENTVGKLIEGRSPDEIAKMRFADIACGSGSFLLGVFDHLIAYHAERYAANKTRRADALKKKLCRETDDGNLQLTLEHKRDILLNNIYGVDLDAQAVEVAQLSLYLKLLEEENAGTIQPKLTGLKEQLLPNLNRNIVHGNSLVDFDVLDGQLFDSKELRKLNPMSFENTFPGVFSKGGFDAIVGNPPYVRMEGFKPIKNYLKRKYHSHDERSDLYSYFIERANRLLSSCGKYGVIVSNKFLRANYGKPLRDFLTEHTNIEQVVDFAGLPVFSGATVRTIILISSPKTEQETVTLYSPPISLEKFRSLHTGGVSVAEVISDLRLEIPASALRRDGWSFEVGKAAELLERIKVQLTSLAEYTNGEICMGVKSGLTEAFVINAETRSAIVRENPAADEIIKPYVNGRDVRRYQVDSKNQFLIYTFHGVNINRYPAVRRHLQQWKERLEKRATKQAWYELQQPQLKFAEFMSNTKIIFPDISITTRFALDCEGRFGSNTTYFIPRNDLYLLALLNSRIGFFYFSRTCAGLEGTGETYLRFFGQYLEGFPVRVIDFGNAMERSVHDRIVDLVEKIIAAKKSLVDAGTDADRQFYERFCEKLDRDIDELVYQLYDITPEERRIIEGA